MPGDRRRPSKPDSCQEQWLSGFRLERLDPDRFEACVGHADFGGGVAVSCMRFGGAVEIEMQPLLATYLVVLPARGEVRMVCGGSDALATPERAVIVDPGDAHWQVWAADTEALLVQVAASRVCAAGEAGAAARLPIELDVTTEPGRGW